MLQVILSDVVGKKNNLNSESLEDKFFVSNLSRAHRVRGGCVKIRDQKDFHLIEETLLHLTRAHSYGANNKFINSKSVLRIA